MGEQHLCLSARARACKRHAGVPRVCTGVKMSTRPCVCVRVRSDVKTEETDRESDAVHGEHEVSRSSLAQCILQVYNTITEIHIQGVCKRRE